MNDEISTGPALPPDSERLIALGTELRPRALRLSRSTWRVLEGRVVRSRTRVATATWAAALTACAAVVAGIELWGARDGSFAHVRPSSVASPDGWREVELTGVGRLSLAPGTRVRLPDPVPEPTDTYAVTLDRGQLCAQIAHRDLARQGPFVVEAPDLRVTVIGTHFCVFADAAPSWVSVEEGRVRIDARGKESVFVGAGESLRADDPRLQPPAPVASSTPESAIAQRETSALRQMEPSPFAPAGTLVAQNALYQSGLLAERTRGPSVALGVWEKYRQRYPEGAFTAEVDLRRVRALRGADRAEAALSAAEEFPKRHPDDWRSNEVELIRADLLRQRFDRPEDALTIYRQVLASEGRTTWHEQATYGACVSLLALSRTTEAREEAQKYLSRFPQGEHASELRPLLSPE